MINSSAHADRVRTAAFVDQVGLGGVEEIRAEVDRAGTYLPFFERITTSDVRLSGKLPERRTSPSMYALNEDRPPALHAAPRNATDPAVYPFRDLADTALNMQARYDLDVEDVEMYDGEYEDSGATGVCEGRYATGI